MYCWHFVNKKMYPQKLTNVLSVGQLKYEGTLLSEIRVKNAHQNYGEKKSSRCRLRCKTYMLHPYLHIWYMKVLLRITFTFVILATNVLWHSYRSVILSVGKYFLSEILFLSLIANAFLNELNKIKLFSEN